MEGEGLRASLQKYFFPPLTDKLLFFFVVIRAPLTEKPGQFQDSCVSMWRGTIGDWNAEYGEIEGLSEGWMLPNPQPHPPVGYKMLHEPAMSSAEK